MRTALALGLALCLSTSSARPEELPLPRTASGWKAELVAQAPKMVFPTAIVVAPDGTIFLGQDPMDMPGPPTEPIDSVVAIKDGKVTVFAEKLWSVMGLEWIDGTLYVVHAPFLSALRDTNGDGRADSRIDLMTGLGPKLPGFNGINEHVASGIRLGMDGFLYISIGDKGIPRGVGRDGTVIQMFGGGVIRIRPDGTGLEVVSTGERNPLSVALGASDEIFTYGNDDDSKRWPNSLTHHIVGGHYGYPYQFLTAPDRALPIVGGQIGGAGTQGISYNEDGLPAQFRGNLFFCDWGLQTVFRYELEKDGGTFKLKAKQPFVTKGEVSDFRPFSLAVGPGGASLYLVDWAYDGWLASGIQTGRLYRLTYEGPDKVTPKSRPVGSDLATRIRTLDHPALAVRLESQRIIVKYGRTAISPLVARLRAAESTTGRLHSIWALDAIGTAEARAAIRSVLSDPDSEVRLQSARSSGIRRDRAALGGLTRLLRDRDSAVRREAAIALGRLGDPAAGPSLMAALGDPDTFAAWSIRWATRTLHAWNEPALVAALVDPKRRDDALKLTDEAWELPVVNSLAAALAQTKEAAVRARIVVNLAGLYRQYPPWSGQWFGTNPLAGQFPQKTRDWDAAGMARVLEGLERGLNDADAEVRRQAIGGLMTAGAPAASLLRARVSAETDTLNLAAMIQTLGTLSDAHAVPALIGLLQDGKRPIEVRAAALDALAKFRDRQAMLARLSVVYDKNGPADLVARAVLALGRIGVLPPNDLAGFLDHPTPAVRMAALWSLGAAPNVPADVRQAILARLDDPAPEVCKSALSALGALKLRESIPKLITIAQDKDKPYHTDAVQTLCVLPDPRALVLYLEALNDRNPDLRRAAESALLAVRDLVAVELEAQARSGQFKGPAALAIERILTRFRPLVDWRVIGPFPRTTAQVFSDASSPDLAKVHAGAAGKPVGWTQRKGDEATGRVVIDDFKAGAGDRGGFGYDTNSSPDLAAFAYTEVDSDRDRSALLLIGSNGTLALSVNGKLVYDFVNSAGRAFAPDTDRIQVELKQGKNRFLVRARQGIGVWSFSLQVAEPSESLFATRPGSVGLEELRTFALENEGNPARGEAIFFDARGIGCAKCHSAGGRGKANVGPDLTGLALNHDKAEIIRSVLDPSSRIATGYQPVLVATRDGQVFAGLVRGETAATIDLINADAKLTRVLKSEIDERRAGNVSLMPTGLVDTLSPAEFADLIAYLQSLKLAAQPAAARR